MKTIRCLFSSALTASALFFTPQAEAAEENFTKKQVDLCETGCAYENCRRAPNISPCFALGFVVAVGIITLVVVNGNSHGFSSHSHS